MKTKNPYVFEKLDDLVSFELSALVFTSSHSDEDVKALVNRFNTELRRLNMEFRQRFFDIKDEGKGVALVAKHSDAVVLLINRVHAFMQTEKAKDLAVMAALNRIMKGLHDLRGFIKLNYGRFMSAELLMPITELQAVSAMIVAKRLALRSKLLDNHNPEPACDIVIEILDEFCSRVAAGLVMRVRDADYYKMIVSNIEDYGSQDTAFSNCPSLHELLLFWNLNSKTCIRYFCVGIELHIGAMLSVDAKLEYLQDQLKKVSVLPQNPGFIYDEGYPSIKTFFTDFLTNEINYLENKRVGFLPNEEYKEEREKLPLLKVLCLISGDQISLFLRAANDVKVIVARSVAAVYNSIVPYLSTERQVNLSAGNMRVKSYQAEDRDKEILITKLEEMIEVIKAY